MSNLRYRLLIEGDRKTKHRGEIAENECGRTKIFVNGTFRAHTEKKIITISNNMKKD